MVSKTLVLAVVVLLLSSNVKASPTTITTELNCTGGFFGLEERNGPAGACCFNDYDCRPGAMCKHNETLPEGVGSCTCMGIILTEKRALPPSEVPIC